MRASFSASKSRRRRRVCLEVLEDRQLLSIITVNTTADNTTPGATLSLRQAIEVSDGTLAVSALSTQEQAQVSGAVGATNTIDFNIPTTDQGYNATTGVWTIAVQSALPTVSTSAAIINGYSQPGASKNTLAQGDNAKLAIALDGATAGSINGLTIGQQGSQIIGLDIENFYEAGVLITGTGVQVAGCFIGTDATGETAAPNAAGVILENSSNMIGGPNVADRNVLSGAAGIGVQYFENDGVYVPDQASNPLNIEPTGNVIENNIIGLDATGTKAIANQFVGVYDIGSGDTYGGTTAGLGNVISGNFQGGLDASGGATIEGNYIGTDVTGKVAIGNGQSGSGILSVESDSATSISMTISNNVVSGNNDGIFLLQTVGSQSSYTIADNFIGTDASGTAAMGNKEFGLVLSSVDNATVQNNVISANGTGVDMDTIAPSTDVQHDVFQGNLIGTDRTGQVALGNTNIGIEIDSGRGILFGGTGPGQGNVIANNGEWGIYAPAGQQFQFTRNSIYNNATGAITLGSLQNERVSAPTLTFTPGTGGTGTISGTLNELPNTSYVVEIFSNPTAQSGGGQTFVKDVTVTTGASSGYDSFSLSEPAGFYTATVTDPLGDTSEFSSAAGAAALPASVTTVSSSANPSTPGQQVTFTAIVTSPSYSGTPTGTVTFTIDGQAQTPVSLAVVGSKEEAQFTTATLAAGAHSVSAAYSGDTNVSSSMGSLPTQSVTAPGLKATSTTLISSLNPSTVGQPVTFTAVVSPGALAGTPTGTVTFSIDGIAQSPVPLQVVKGSDQASVSIASLTKGTHTISALYSGDGAFAGSAVAGSLVQTVHAVIPPGVDGPTVVTVKRFGIHMQQTVLVLSFNDGLDPTSAQNQSNYKIVGPAGRSVSIGSAVFNAATNTVTLRPTSRINLHHTYHLTVIGTGPHGVTNTEGVLLDGANTGKPGSNYTGTLTWRNVVWAPGELGKNGQPKPYRPA